MRARFVLSPLTEAQARRICTWRYPAPYDLYNWPDWNVLEAKNEEFADPAIRREQYRAVTTRDGELAGFAQLFPLEGWTRLGLGLRPDMCGQGVGPDFVRAIADHAKREYPERKVDLEVMTWNERAIRTYIKAGFVIRDTYVRSTPTGPGEFHCMEDAGS